MLHILGGRAKVTHWLMARVLDCRVIKNNIADGFGRQRTMHLPTGLAGRRARSLVAV
jgi:hypothetical protein